MSDSARARPASKPRAASRPGPRGGPKPAPMRSPAASGSGWQRWRWVAILVLAGLVGLPLAHAVLGEVAALLGATFLLGFLMGRWTTP